MRLYLPLLCLVLIALCLAPTFAFVGVDTPPNVPTSIVLTPPSPTKADANISAVATGTDPDGDLCTFEYQWSTNANGPWGNDGDTLPNSVFNKGETWYCQARTLANGLYSGWSGALANVTIGDAPPNVPTSIVLTPPSPTKADANISAVATGTDPDGDLCTFTYQWSTSAGGPWGNDGDTLPNTVFNKGETWYCRAMAHAAGLDSEWSGALANVTIGDAAPNVPTSIGLTPPSPTKADANIAAVATGIDPDGDTCNFTYQWSTNAGGPWGHDGDTLPNTVFSKGETWHCRAMAHAAGLDSAWSGSLASVTIGDAPPNVPTSIVLAPTTPIKTDASISAVATGTDPDGDPCTFTYEWAKDPAGPWGNAGSTLPNTAFNKGETWYCRAMAHALGLDSAWSAALANVTIGDAAPTIPTAVSITPASPITTDDLVGHASGATDPDGDVITDDTSYEFEWAKSTDSGATWGAWGNTGGTLPASLTTRSDRWKCRARAQTGSPTLVGPWRESLPVQIFDNPPLAPTALTITPNTATNPVSDDSLVGSAAGGVDPDGDPVSYQYQWAVSTDGGTTYDAFGRDGATIAAALTTRGEYWQLRARSVAGSPALFSPWTTVPVNVSVLIHDAPPTAPGKVTVTPANPDTTQNLTATRGGADSTDPDGDIVAYHYQWQKKPAGATTWTDTGTDSPTLDASLTNNAERWRCVMTATSGTPTLTGPGRASNEIVIKNTPPVAPPKPVITWAASPVGPRTLDDLTVVPGTTTDIDPLDTLTYTVQWARSADSGGSWGSWGDDGNTLPNARTFKGQWWKARLVVSDGYDSVNTESDPVVIADSAPTAPGKPIILPAAPKTADDLSVTPAGATDVDGDAITYLVEWSSDSGITWGNPGATLSHTLTAKGQAWQARVTALSAFTSLTGGPVVSDPVTIGNTAPSAPSSVVITPASPVTADDLTVTAGAATDPDTGDILVTSYEWSKSLDGGFTWQSDNPASVWGYAGNSISNLMTSRGEYWRARARVYDGTDYGPWRESASVVIGNTAPTLLGTPSILPASPTALSILTVSGVSGNDVDGDTVTLRYQWRSLPVGGTWGPWISGSASQPATSLTRGDQWQVRVAPYDGTNFGTWSVSGAVTILNSAPTAATAVTFTPARPAGGQSITAVASGATDKENDALTYQYVWLKSINDGVSFDATAYVTDTLPINVANRGEQWEVSVMSFDGALTGPAFISAPVTIGNAAPTAPLVTLSPTNPTTSDVLIALASGSHDSDGDTISYQYRWLRSQDGGATWATIANSGLSTLAATSLTRGDIWKVQGRAADGNGGFSAWVGSAALSIDNTAPTVPLQVAIAPLQPNALDNLQGVASGSTDADHDAITYEFEWSFSDDQGANWSPWGSPGQTLTGATLVRGQMWICRVRANDGISASDWLESSTVTVIGMAPSPPTQVRITPTSPDSLTDLTATASGSTDGDGDTVSYIYQWSRSDDLGQTWSGWNWDGDVLPASETSRGQMWRARAYATDGELSSALVESAAVTIGNTAPDAPNVQITPGEPGPTTDLVASASGSDPDGDALTYEYQWSRSLDGGVTWSAWSWTGDTLGNAATDLNDLWRVQARSFDGTLYSAWTISDSVRIVGMLASQTPVNGATNVTRVNPLWLTFRQVVKPASAQGHFRLTDALGTAVTGQFLWTVPGQTVRFRPSAPLAAGTHYTLTLGTGIALQAGGVLGWGESYGFVTGSEPVVLAVTPRGNVSGPNTITILFDQAMHKASTQNCFSISPAVAGTFAWSGKQLIYRLSEPLEPGTTYTVTEGRKARASLTGIELRRAYSWSFTVASPGSTNVVSAAVTNTAAGSQIMVSLSAAANVHVEICNVAGRVVAELPAQDLPAGMSTLLWNGRGASGTFAPGGTYLVRVQACGAGGAQTNCLVPLQR